MEEQLPTVSIVIPNKNRSDELVQTLDSVRGQTFSDWQCLIVDDNSTDAFEDRVRPYLSDTRFTVIRQPKGVGGAPAARNRGAARSAGRYVIFLDSDDLLAHGCLANRVPIMDARPDLDFAVFQCQLFRSVPGDTALMWNLDSGEDDLDRLIRHDVPWQTSGPIWRRTALAKFGPWDEAARSAQDWEFHLRAVLAGLRYERFGPIDFYWRMASADRASIGKSAIVDAEHHRSRIDLYRRIYRTVCEAGQMTDARRRHFAAAYFSAAEKLGQKVGRTNGRRAWRAALEDGVVTRPMYWRGWWLLANQRWPGRYEKMRQSLLQRFPEQYALPRSTTFLKAPLPEARVSPPSVAEVA